MIGVNRDHTKSIRKLIRYRKYSSEGMGMIDEFIALGI